MRRVRCARVVHFCAVWARPYLLYQAVGGGGMCLLACVFPLVKIYVTILHILFRFVSFQCFCSLRFLSVVLTHLQALTISNLWAQLSQQFHAASKLYCMFAKGSKTFNLHYKSVPPKWKIHHLSHAGLNVKMLFHHEGQTLNGMACTNLSFVLLSTPFIVRLNKMSVLSGWMLM